MLVKIGGLNNFAVSDALKQVLALAADSLDEVYEISIQECKD